MREVLGHLQNPYCPHLGIPYKFCRASMAAFPKNSIPGAPVSMIQRIGTTIFWAVNNETIVILLHLPPSRYKRIHEASSTEEYFYGIIWVKNLESLSGTSNIRLRQSIKCPRSKGVKRDLTCTSTWCQLTNQKTLGQAGCQFLLKQKSLRKN